MHDKPIPSNLVSHHGAVMATLAKIISSLSLKNIKKTQAYPAEYQRKKRAVYFIDLLNNRVKPYDAQWSRLHLQVLRRYAKKYPQSLPAATLRWEKFKGDMMERIKGVIHNDPSLLGHDKLMKTKKKMHRLTLKVAKTIDQMQRRGQSLHELAEQTSALEKESLSFDQEASSLEQSMQYKKHRFYHKVRMIIYGLCTLGCGILSIGLALSTNDSHSFLGLKVIESCMVLSLGAMVVFAGLTLYHGIQKKRCSLPRITQNSGASVDAIKVQAVKHSTPKESMLHSKEHTSSGPSVIKQPA